MAKCETACLCHCRARLLYAVRPSRQTVSARGSPKCPFQQPRKERAGRWFEIAAEAVKMGAFDGRLENDEEFMANAKQMATAALTEGSRNSQAGSQLGAPLFFAARPADQAASGRLLRPGNASRRNRRTLVRLDHAGGQRGSHARRRAELCRPGQRPLHAARRGGRSRAREIVGKPIWNAYKRWPVYSKFFDNMGPIPHHMHQSYAQAKLVGQEGKPESVLLPAAAQRRRQQFPLHLHGPGAGDDQGGRRAMP